MHTWGVLNMIGQSNNQKQKISYLTEPLLQRMSCLHFDPILAPEVARAVNHPKLELTA
jgi:hypothetical protein